MKTTYTVPDSKFTQWCAVRAIIPVTQSEAVRKGPNWDITIDATSEAHAKIAKNSAVVLATPQSTHASLA